MLIDQLTICLPVSSGTLAGLCHKLGAAGIQIHALMCLAVGEALGNAVDHTCEGGVLATVSAYPDRAIVEVTDCGQGFIPEDDEPDVPLCAERGRGIKLMRLLADSLVISQKPTGGTVVRLVKLSHPYQTVE